MSLTEEKIEIILDLRGFLKKLATPSDYISFWKDLERYFYGKKVEAGKSYRLESGDDMGVIQINVISCSSSILKISDGSKFAVHSVLDNPSLKYQCSDCLKINSKTYGPFSCQDVNCKKRLCVDHAIILDGNMKAFCSDHAPRCNATGKIGSFWCYGPKCRGKIAWSDDYRRSHPYNSDYWYCPECFDIKFPKCSSETCDDIATNKCDYFDRVSNKICGKNICNKHLTRWQIYGPNQNGLNLCQQHNRVGTFSQEEIIFQIISGTATRNLRKFKKFQRTFLPTLQMIKYIFINTQNTVFEIPKIYEMIKDVYWGLDKNTKLGKQMVLEIENSFRKWDEDIKRASNSKEIGLSFFNTLKNTLLLSNHSELAASISFSDYSSRTNILFIRLPIGLRGKLIGKGGSHINELQRIVGCKISFERN